METSLHSWFLANQGAQSAQRMVLQCWQSVLSFQLKSSWIPETHKEAWTPSTSTKVEHSSIYTKSMTPRCQGSPNSKRQGLQQNKTKGQWGPSRVCGVPAIHSKTPLPLWGGRADAGPAEMLSLSEGLRLLPQPPQAWLVCIASKLRGIRTPAPCRKRPAGRLQTKA